MVQDGTGTRGSFDHRGGESSGPGAGWLTTATTATATVLGAGSGSAGCGATCTSQTQTSLFNTGGGGDGGMLLMCPSANSLKYAPGVSIRATLRACLPLCWCPASSPPWASGPWGSGPPQCRACCASPQPLQWFAKNAGDHP